MDASIVVLLVLAANVEVVGSAVAIKGENLRHGAVDECTVVAHDNNNPWPITVEHLKYLSAPSISLNAQMFIYSKATKNEVSRSKTSISLATAVRRSSTCTMRTRRPALGARPAF